MSTVSFVAQLDSGILCLDNAFLFTYHVNGFKPGINRHLLSVGSFCSSFSSISMPCSGFSAFHGMNLS